MSTPQAPLHRAPNRPPVDVSGLLAGTVAVVAGAASGIGRAVAARLSQAGAQVELADVDERALGTTLGELRAAGLSAAGSVVDASDDAAVGAFIASVADRHGRLDALVNSVGIQRYGTVETTPLEVWDEVMAVNLRSMFLMARHSVPLMRRHGGGAVVNVASAQAVASQRNVVAYTASKGAIVAFTRAMAVDHAGEGIRVNCVLPGSIDTPMLRAAASSLCRHDPQSVILTWGRGHPIGRVGQPAEVADACLYLVSPLSSFVTGAELRVDGGVLAGVGLAAPSEASGDGPLGREG
ncbi:MAG TPA: SDR family NAD(P)-dependent oxidoreductase [Acidimicrobiales bacterium]|nr:SDR family NAD(P)-dependent oxidoreductase [Acidimicrobiales bacterium]